MLLLIWTCHVQKQRFNHSWHLHFVKPSFFARNKLCQNNRSPQSHKTNTIVLCPLEIYIVTCKWGFDKPHILYENVQYIFQWKCKIEHVVDMVHSTVLHNKSVSINCQFIMASCHICTAKYILARPTFVL